MDKTWILQIVYLCTVYRFRDDLRVCSPQLLKIMKVTAVYGLLTKDGWIPSNRWRMNCTWTSRLFIKSFIKIWERERCAESQFHIVSQISKRNAVLQLVNTSSRPIRPIHIFSIALLLEMSLGCQYKPDTHPHSMEWRPKSSPRPKKFHLKPSRNETRLIFFFNKSVIHKEFVPVGKTVNSEFYIQVLDRLLE